MIEISKEKQKLQIDIIYSFLSTSYWAKERSKEDIAESIDHSICYGVYIQQEQIGFARIISDRVTFAYLADVFIVEKYRKKGYSKQLMQAILEDEALKKVKSWYLVTKDAQGLYQQFGFANYHNPPSTVMKKMKI